jgi:hypothetical protein
LAFRSGGYASDQAVVPRPRDFLSVFGCHWPSEACQCFFPVHFEVTVADDHSHDSTSMRWRGLRVGFSVAMGPYHHGQASLVPWHTGLGGTELWQPLYRRCHPGHGEAVFGAASSGPLRLPARQWFNGAMALSCRLPSCAARTGNGVARVTQTNLALCTGGSLWKQHPCREAAFSSARFTFQEQYPCRGAAVTGTAPPPGSPGTASLPGGAIWREHPWVSLSRTGPRPL